MIFLHISNFRIVQKVYKAGKKFRTFDIAIIALTYIGTYTANLLKIWWVYNYAD